MTDAPCTPTTYGPCAPYASLGDVGACGQCGDLDLSIPEDPEETPSDTVVVMQKALVWASRRVFEATGGQWWGCCEITVRPCRPTECTWPAGWPAGAYPPPPFGGVPVQPWEYLPAIPVGTFTAEGDPVFVNIWRCSCAGNDPCSCGAVGDRIVLPFGPVRDVLEVKIDGEVLDADAWGVDPRDGALVRLDGETWPGCQDVFADEDAEGTWSVRYRHGNDAPPELAPLVAAMACEAAKDCLGGDCALPPGFKVVHRDGVDFGVVEPAEYRQQGLTGFGPVDDWIMLMRGGHVGLQDAPRAYRPRLQELF